MRTVFIVQRGTTDQQMFNEANRDNCSDPFITLRTRMASVGCRLRCLGEDRVEDADWILFFDAPSVAVPSFARIVAERALGREVSGRSRDVYGECIRAGMYSRIALFLWEGSVVLPTNWSDALHEKFPLVFTWHDDFAQKDRYRKVHLPQPARFPHVPRRSFAEKKLLVNISANKASRQPSELYTMRRMSIRYFESRRPDDFDLFGVGWDRKIGITNGLAGLRRHYYPSYRGTVPHKWEVFPRYRFALCYENNSGAPGYITEKIFDCMRSDCVPIYLGAPNVAQYIPSDAFIDRRQFASDAELEDFLVSITEERYDAYRSAIADFLASRRFTVFLEGSFAGTVISALHLARTSEQAAGEGM